MAAFPLVSATGMLGSGFRAESLDKAIALGARMIGCDAGSTDPGPGPLATGTCMFSAAAVKRDTEIMMTRAIKAGIPLIIGSAGTSGSDAGLAWMVNIVRDIARAQGARIQLGRTLDVLAEIAMQRSRPLAEEAEAELSEIVRLIGPEVCGLPWARRRKQSTVPGGEASGTLTPREREVAMLLARGLTNRQIAETLVIAEGTAGVHVDHILSKLNFRSRAQVLRFFDGLELVEPGLIRAPEWRPDSPEDTANPAEMWAGVARKP